MKRLILFFGGLLSSLVIFSSPALAATATSTARDCDTNAVYKCGALTTKELQIKYMNPNDPSGRYILNAFGITNQDIQDIDAKAVMGQVTKSGEVLVNGKVVATNAVTAGRLNLSGSTKTVYQGVTFYKRPPSVSFRSAALQAFVVMENGVFKYAVMTSCSNPVNATPVAQKPAPVAPAVVTTPPVIKTVTIQKIVEVPKQLAVTGPSNIIGLASGVTVAGALGHAIFIRRQKLFTQLQK